MRSLLFMSIAIAVAAVSIPDLVARYAERHAGGARAGASVGQLRGEAGGGSEGRQVTIPAERDGHFYVEAEINLRPVRLMVDTGASVIALRQSDAEAIGLRPVPADFDQPVQTANGMVYAARAELDSVSVRDVEVNGVSALILPDAQLGISLLGASFLNRLARFQVERGTLIFEN